jgi:UDP-glucose 4-epimerase
MKAIVFGGAGFVGSHVADALVAAGHEVTIFDRRPSPYLSAGQTMVVGDILDAGAVRAAATGHGAVYNFAGLADIDEALEKPVETAQANIVGCAQLLEAARLSGAHRFVQASTIYVSSEAGGFYRASKQACELWVEEYQRQFNLDFTILRYGTLYGGRSDSRNSVRRYLRQALIDRRIRAQATGDEIREYIHVRDAATSSVEILKGEYRNQSVILTGQYPMRFRDLLHMIREIVGTDVAIDLEAPRYEPTDARGHYSFTPYSFRPKIARKLVASSYIELGQGLLECLEEIHDEGARSGATTST